jgi:nucleotide-binding universal stress UspA family protein
MRVKAGLQGEPRMQAMNAYPNVLVAVDGSEPSQRGLDEAIRLVKTHGGKLKIVHIVDELPAVANSGYYAEPVVESMQAKGRQILEAAAAAARAAGVDAEVELVECVGGRTSSFIVDAAKEEGASLIVLGTHGRRGLRRLAMGSDAEEVVRSSSVPVLLVRGGEAI